MQKQLYPKEVIESTVEAYLLKVSVKSQLIYSSIVLVLIGGFAALPFISIDVLDKITEYLSENNFDNIGFYLVYEFGSETQIADPTNFNRKLIYFIEHCIHNSTLLRIGI